MSAHPSPTTLTGLTAELRCMIFTTLFRSTTLRANMSYSSFKDKDSDPLAILRVCRQFHSEAGALVVPNARFFCNGNAAVITVLTWIGPARIAQIRYLLVAHNAVGLQLGQGPEPWPRGGIYPYAEEDHKTPEGVRFFHLGAVLSLFPGLQLDLLEVVHDIGGGRYTGFQTTDCFGSLLAADGYRRLWMEAAAGSGQEWHGDRWSVSEWKGDVARRIAPYGGSVEIMLDNGWSGHDLFRLKARDAGISLTEVRGAKVDCYWDGDWDKEDGHQGDNFSDVVVYRGETADIAVKPGGDKVLRCIERTSAEESPAYFKRASDALRKLFKEHSWDAIRAMDGFDDGEHDCSDYSSAYNPLC